MTEFDDITFSLSKVTRRAVDRAELLITHYNLHARPWERTNLWPLLRELDIRFMTLDPNLHGFVLDMKNKIIVGINDALTTEQTTYVAAHEIGHIALRHPNQVNFCMEQATHDRAVETEANAFAAILLLPRAAVFDALASPDDVRDVADYYGVPVALVHIRVSLFELLHI